MSEKAIILIVGDLHNQSLSAIRDILEMHGYETTTATDSVEAWGKIEEQPPDLIFFDLTSHEVEGYSFITELHSNEVWAFVQVIFCLKNDYSSEDWNRCMVSGAHDCIKPHLRPKELLDSVETAIHRSTNFKQLDTIRIRKEVFKEETVLVVEDQYLLLMAIRDVLEMEGYAVMLAGDGIDALAVMERVAPDLIVADISMPRMDGYRFFEAVHTRPDWASIPFVFLTARAEREDRMKGRAMGAEDYLVKPFDPQELLVVVSSRIMRAKATREAMESEFVNEIKRLHKQLTDLRYQLAEYKEKEHTSSSERFPLAEVSRLTGGIIHDLRNGLGIISSTMDFLKDDLTTEEQLSDLRKITGSLEFCELVLRNLTALGGHDTFQPTRIDLERAFRDVYFMLERKLINVELVVDSDPQVVEILADRGHIKQIFMNLIKNAGEAMPEGGTLTFRTRREGDHLRIEISDTGQGISKKNQKRLFREFFTTKTQGYGLGLHIVNTIVKRHGGTIEVDSKWRKGTTFVLRLPIGIGGTNG